jgi:hypothetical protein
VTSDPITDKNSLRSAINREIELVASEAAAKAIAGDATAAQVERLKTLQSVLAALPEKSTIPLSLAAIIGITCLLSASLALVIQIPSTRVQLDLTTTSISMRLDTDLPWHGTWPFDPKQVRLRNFTRIELPPEYGPRQVSSIELNVARGRVRVGHLFFGRGASVTIAANESGAVDIVVSGAPFRGDVNVSGEINGHAGLDLNESLPLKRFDPEIPPGRFGFLYDGQHSHAQQPPFIHGLPVETLTLHDIRVTDLSFVEERPKPARPDQSTLISQIASGTITMTDTGEQITLVPGADLQLANIRGRIAALQVTNKEIQVKFEGTASDVTLGTGDFTRNLKPTILDWLFHQQRLGLFWGALTFLWGIAWSTRKLFSGLA